MLIEILKEKANLISIISVIYLFSFILGGILNKVKPKIFKIFEKTEEQKLEQGEKLFGKYREELKEGRVKTFITCVFMVFLLNLFGNITSFMIGSMLIFPLIFLFLDGIRQGASLFTIKGSTIFSVISFCFIFFLELITYILSMTGGLNIALSVLEAIREKSVSFSVSLYGSFKELVYIFFLVMMILLIQAILEVLYVRKVLKEGGSAIPLKPY